MTEVFYLYFVMPTKMVSKPCLNIKLFIQKVIASKSPILVVDQSSLWSPKCVEAMKNLNPIKAVNAPYETGFYRCLFVILMMTGCTNTCGYSIWKARRIVCTPGWEPRLKILDSVLWPSVSCCWQTPSWPLPKKMIWVLCCSTVKTCTATFSGMGTLSSSHESLLSSAQDHCQPLFLIHWWYW